MSTQPHSLVWDGQPDHEPANGQVWIDPVGNCFVGPRRIVDSHIEFGPRRCYDASPAPAVRKGVEERLVILELDLKGLAKFTERRLLALESQPVLSVPEVKVPGHSVTEVDSINLQALYTTAIKCGMTNAYRGSLLQRIAKRMDDMHTEREPASPQRTPAEVEGGESVGMRIVRQWIGSERFAKLTDTSSEHWLIEAIDEAIALSTAPRGKVPSVEQIERAICHSRTCEGMMCCQNPAQMGRASCPVKAGGYADAADAILALFTEGNARG